MPQPHKHSENERIQLTSDIIISAVPELDKELAAFSKKDVEVNKGLAYGEVEVIVSNSAVDRYGERIIMEGVDISQIKRNPVVLWGHQYSNLPIGQIVRIWKS